MFELNVAHLLSKGDWWVFMTIFALSCVAGFWARRKRSSDSRTEYLLMGRQLTLPMLVATLVATWYGEIFGVTQIAFEKGLYMFFTQGVCWYAAYLLFAFFVASRLRRTGALSFIDLIRRQYGPRSAQIVGYLLLGVTLPLSCAVGAGLLLQSLFGWPLALAMSIAILVVAAYCQRGGLRAVVWSDVVQCVAMFVGALLVLGFSVGRHGGLSFLTASLPATHWSLSGSWQGMIVWFAIAAALTVLNPMFYQRCLAAKDEKVAKRGMLLACMLWVVFDCCTLFGALYARAVLPEADSLYAYLHYGIAVLPVGLKGLFLAGLLATVLSTLDSTLFVASSILSDDLKLAPHISTSIRRLAALVVVSALTLLLPYWLGIRAEQLWLQLNGFFAATTLLPMICGPLLRLCDWEFVGCAALGGSCMLVGALLRRIGLVEIEPCLVGQLGALVGLTGVGVSIWSRRTFSSLPTGSRREVKRRWPAIES